MNLNDICNVMKDLGAENLYFKCLAENDNSKNQIYMGVTLLLSIFSHFRMSLQIQQL